ncbi:MAG: hypothetical protein ACKVYV_05860 [Limisphaerales bacterium]
MRLNFRESYRWVPALAVALAPAAVLAQYNAEHFIATGPGQDTPFFFRSNYQDGELFVFEGLIQDNNGATGTGGGAEISLWESPKTTGNIRASSPLPWSTAASSGFIVWEFQLDYLPGDKITYSLSAPLQTPRTGTWDLTSNPLGNLAATPAKPDTLLSDIIIRARPAGQTPGTADTEVSLTDLQLKVGAGVYENILNPVVADNDLVARANNPLGYNPVQFLFLDDVLTPAQSFSLKGKAGFSWESPLVGGSSPISGAGLAWEFKVGSFAVVPEGEVLWAAVPLAGVAGWFIRRRVFR